jgi:Zn-dependent protease with chaperone function
MGVLRVCLVAGLLCAVQVHAQSAVPTFPDPGKTSISKDNQRALGMEVAGEVYKQMPVLPDSSAESQYIRQLGQKLVATIPQEYSWPFEFHVVPQKEINAFALPGGQMFINVGTIRAAKSEAELAGVMGHEMAHVYMQHSAKQASKAQTTGMLTGLAAAVLGGPLGDKGGGLVGQLGQLGVQLGAEGVMMKYSRGDESQADAVGAVILYKAGYNPQGMADFFRTMGSEGGAAPPAFFSSHPNPNNRQQAVQKQIAAWPAGAYAPDSAEFTTVRQSAAELRVFSAEEIAKGAKAGQWEALNQRNGASLRSGGGGAFPTRAEAEAAATPAPVIPHHVLPSQRMVDHDLGPMKIRRPENWPVTLPERQGQFVTIASAAGVTNRGVGYGVLLNSAPAPRGQRMSLDDMTSALIAAIQQQNTDMQQVDKAKPIAVGATNIEGRSTFLQSPSPFPAADGQVQKERDWLVTVPRSDGSLIFMIFVAPEADFARFQPAFEAMIKSAQFR